MTYKTIISANELAEHLHDTNWVILDARFTLDDETWGQSQYQAGHIPGAHYANLAADLSGTVIPGHTGRRPLPPSDVFANTLSQWGIGPNTQVIVYDASGGLMAASRTWWMLRWLGHDAVAVLDGGWTRWLNAGYPIASEVPTLTPALFVAQERTDYLANVELVDNVRQNPEWAVFDSRSEAGFHGGGVYHDPVRGHIVGARLADRANTLDSHGLFRSPQELRQYYTRLLGEIPIERTVFYCGSGVTAAQNLLAVAHAGLGDAKHYVGSWSEWIIDPARPVEL
ncbi:sulfurtransferase [Yersinia pekkanenii]|uniref:Sulfurtransferase n=1 Tax=Yersinia pekkanenii TaxID=1288385 RepID=A0A0T9NEW7_9GAMM|nr:sulfurtransferase [Yersinia pekkanenii]CNH04047.1 putative sulfurtransferase [Yersinia pekkanenii]CRY63866.1 putative sulfurtransferase [Yersinia pekkanenii]